MLRCIVMGALLLLAVPGLVQAAETEMQAEPVIYDGLTADEAAALLAGAGYAAHVMPREGLSPQVEAVANGLTFRVNFLGGDGGQPERYAYLQLRARFPGDAAQQEKALQYNREKVFGRVYNLDDSSYIEHAMHLKGGFTALYFENMLRLWDSVLTEFADYIQ